MSAAEAKAAAKPAYTPRTIAALIADYIDTPTFRSWKPNTLKGYLSRFEAIRVTHGHRTVADMTSDGIEKAILAPTATALEPISTHSKSSASSRSMQSSSNG
jgi:hypothetical protein